MYSTARQSGRSLLRPAFTLVELLVVMGVLALMSSMVLVGLASAAEQARVARTRGQIQKIHELLMTRWDEYRYRRVEAPRGGYYIDPSKSTTVSVPLKSSVRARQALRLDRLRELMRMEMPCHMEDVMLGSAFTTMTLPPDINGDSQLAPSATFSALQARYQRAVSNRQKPSGWSSSFDDSECLYMILESIQDGDTNGLDYFKASEIGDTDDDGMPEILDAWGTPIRFFRWAPGYVGVRSNLHRNDQPDPFDPLNVRGGKLTNPPPNNDQFLHFPLYPLVISAGPDKALDLAVRFSTTSAMNGTIIPTANYPVPNNPYFALHADDASADQLAGLQFGTEGDANGNGVDEFYDNISNHALVISGNAN